MISVNNYVVNVNHFPDGTQNLELMYVGDPSNYSIVWRYEREEELSTLIYITKHLRNIYGTKEIKLKMYYLPNARMDRTHECNEVFTLKYFSDVINWLNFDSVEILDVHSNVGAALINKIVLASPLEYILKVIRKIEKSDSELILYFPDEGAAKRYSGLFPHYKYCYGEKVRDWKTGTILGLDIKLLDADVSGNTILMIDDIVSFGGSFHYSALALAQYEADKIYAYATHTENSILDREKSTLLRDLENNTVERLFTTNSLFTGTHEKITVMEMQK